MRGLVQSLTEVNGAVTVFGLEDEKTQEDIAQWAPLEVKSFTPSGVLPWGYSNQLLPALLDGGFDVLLTHGLWKYSSLASHRWHRATGRPYIIHPHGMLDPWAVRNAKWKKRIAYLAYERAHLAGAACIRALCDAEAQAIRAFGLPNRI
ncbi:MAG TPA: glycosyltransferase, partial [Chthoniobacterales bacterium]